MTSRSPWRAFWRAFDQTALQSTPGFYPNELFAVAVLLAVAIVVIPVTMLVMTIGSHAALDLVAALAIALMIWVYLRGRANSPRR
jgi:hypothetical protein